MHQTSNPSLYNPYAITLANGIASSVAANVSLTVVIVILYLV